MAELLVPEDDPNWETNGTCAHCGGTGQLGCLLCDRDDPGRFGGGAAGHTYPGCVDCGAPPGQVGTVDCDNCHGYGNLVATHAALCPGCDWCKPVTCTPKEIYL